MHISILRIIADCDRILVLQIDPFPYKIYRYLMAFKPPVKGFAVGQFPIAIIGLYVIRSDSTKIHRKGGGSYGATSTEYARPQLRPAALARKRAISAQ